jgi:PAS domain S-box-containing protein
MSASMVDTAGSGVKVKVPPTNGSGIFLTNPPAARRNRDTRMCRDGDRCRLAPTRAADARVECHDIGINELEFLRVLSVESLRRLRIRRLRFEPIKNPDTSVLEGDLPAPDRHSPERSHPVLPGEGRRAARVHEFDLTSTPFAILESMSDGFLVVDGRWRLAYLNPAAAGLFAANGADPDAMIGRHFWDELFPEERDTDAARQWFRAMNERVPVTFENYHAPWGKWYELRLYPMPQSGVAGLFWDITDSKNAEAALRENKAALEEAGHRKDEFLATLAHELRNPLAPLRHGLQIMRLARGNAEILSQAREMMERQVSHIVTLVDDLIDLNRISRGQISIHKERVDLETVVASALDTCETAIRRSHQQLTVALPTEPVHVYADRVRLAQVLSNLLGNASKYTDPGGSISLAVEVEGGEVQIRVKDTGVGIPEHMLHRVFDMFTQVDGSADRAQKGLGIGLTIVKRLIEMHGGTVEARSAGRGMGSEFIVRLPVFFSRIDPQRANGPAGGVPPARHRILVVDDDKDVALGLAMMLRLMGNDTETAYSGREAIEVGEAFRPDVVLMDIGMPEQSGYRAAQRVRETAWGKRARLVAVTGWGQESDRRASAQAGFDQHLVKPVEPRDLESLLASVGQGS